ncbi:MAG TPA: arginyltransferase [Gammaproteobacteria bacterium]|nr:arginyltransferase [Gammaproteobacteria bacterium]
MNTGPAGHRRETVSVYCGHTHPCSYLPRRSAVTQFVDPHQPMDRPLYSSLMDMGFRRSGEFVYRPKCRACDACIPLRVNAAGFQPTRSQRRTWRRNQDLRTLTVEAGFDPRHFALYRRYLAARHPHSDMNGGDPDQYRHFLLSSWCDTRFVEFRLGRILLAVAVVDRLTDGLSAVYTFYEPGHPKRSLGTYAVLWEIEEVRRLGLSSLYLGYWIPECPTMRYKSDFRPAHIHRKNRWMPLTEWRGFEQSQAAQRPL